MKKYNLAIVGVTGLVGRMFLKILDEYHFPFHQLLLYASKKSAGKKIVFKNKEYIIRELSEEAFDDVDIVLFSAGSKVSQEYAPLAVQKGAYVIDNSSAWRMDDNCALVVPEVNMDDIFVKSKIIANPNCSTIQAVLPLKILNDHFGIKRVTYTTYQAVSGSGQKGIEDLKRTKNNHTNIFYPYDISKTCIPEIDEFLDNGCINWDEDFKKMLDAFLRYVQLGNGFSGDDLSAAELLVHLLKDNGDKGFIDDNLTTVLCSCAVAWVKQNPETIQLLDADYIR